MLLSGLLLAGSDMFTFTEVVLTRQVRDSEIFDADVVTLALTRGTREWPRESRCGSSSAGFT
jgi:hypothetical protein